MTAPCAFQMESFIGQPGLYLPADWACGMRLHTPVAGLRLTCIDAHAARPWESEVEGPPAASLCVLLDGCMDTALRGARALRIGSGMCAFMQSSERSAGFNHMHAGRRFRLVGIHLAPEMAQALPADLRSAWQPPRATAHASATLLRAARDLFTCSLPEGPARRLWLTPRRWRRWPCLPIKAPAKAASSDPQTRAQAAPMPPTCRACAASTPCCNSTANSRGRRPNWPA